MQTKPEHIRRSISWQLFDRGTLGVVTMLVNIVVVRVLGPDAAGILLSATAAAAIGEVIAKAGTNVTMPRMLAEHADRDRQFLASTAIVRRGYAVVGFLVALLFGGITMTGNNDAFLLIALLASAWLFPVGDIAELYWVVRGQSHRYIAAKFVANGVGSLLRISAALATGWNVAVAAASGIEAIVREFLQRRTLTKAGLGIGISAASWNACRALATQNLALIGTSLAVVGYHKIDQLMIMGLLGSQAAGHYGAVAQLSQLGLAAALIYGRAWSARIMSEALYEQPETRMLSRALLIGFRISLPIILLTWMLNQHIILLFYGADFQDASATLPWLALSVGLSSVGSLSSYWLAARREEPLLLRRAIAGLTANIILNAILIPVYGIVGAAVASALSQLLAVWLIDLATPRTRALFFIKGRALFDCCRPERAIPS